jgi:uncharacterized protein HemX
VRQSSRGQGSVREAAKQNAALSPWKFRLFRMGMVDRSQGDAGMTYGRILVIGALGFGAIYYYQSEQQERAKETYRHQIALQEAAAAQREAALFREKQEHETAEFWPNSSVRGNKQTASWSNSI